MYSIKKFYLELSLLLFCILLSACGPSPEELVATSAAETAAAATNTPIPSSTPIPTKIPTLTPIPTSTPTPLPKPDAQAMIRWKDLDLPDGSFSVHPETENIQEGEIAMSLEFGDGSTLDYIMTGSFVFIDDMNPSQIIYGYAFSLSTSKHREGFDAYTQNYLKSVINTGFGIPLDSISTISGANDIGDLSAGVTGSYISRLFGVPWQISMISFRIDSIGSFVFIRNDVSVKSPVNIQKVARVYAESIQSPQKTCQITAIKPDLNASVPTFEFEAEGFYPGERRYIQLRGNVLVGGEQEEAVSLKLGGGGESFDLNGYIQDTISFLTTQQLADLGMENAEFPEGSVDFTLVVGGYFSNCEVEEIVTWPEP